MTSKVTSDNDREIFITYKEIDNLLDRSPIVINEVQKYLDLQDNKQYISDTDVVFVKDGTYKLRLTIKPSEHGNN